MNKLHCVDDEEQVAAINDAYKSGKITAEQKAELLKIATPSSR